MDVVIARSSGDPDGAREFRDRARLEAHLRKLAKASAKAPIVVALEIAGYEVWLGLGPAEVVLCIQEANASDELHHEWISVGDENRRGEVAFLVLGEAHSDYEARQLIPFEAALSAALDFVENRVMPTSIRWEENSF